MDENELDSARRHATQRALETLNRLRAEWGGKDLEVLAQAQRFYESRLTTADIGPLAREESRLIRRIKKQLRTAERAAIYELRDEEKIDDDALRALEYEIDLRDATEDA
jgi:hypothetical protein